MEIKSIIKDRRLELELTQREVADYVGVSPATLSRWESGDIANMKRDRIAKLAVILKLSPSKIIGTEEREEKNTEEIVTYPVIGDIAAGYGMEAVEEYTGSEIRIPKEWLKGRKKEDFFALRVRGNSMYPAYQEGDVILVRRQSTLNYSGQVGVMIYEDNNATLKKVEYVMGENWMRLVPINPQYPPAMVEGEALEHCRVLGYPVKLIRDV